LPEYSIVPIAKPRMVRSDRWRKRPATAKYWHFVDLCKLHRVELPCFGAHVTFVLPMPKSWSQKKRVQMDGKPHMQRPDLSNMLKALEDAIYQEDSVIYTIHISKRWGISGKILIEERMEG